MFPLLNFRGKRNCELWKITFSVLFNVLLISQARSQDVGSFLAGLLGTAEVPRNSTDSNQVPCPGECVHAITSILCSKVIEQFNCGASFLRCCVSSDFQFGTVVETSAPLPEESSSEQTTEYEFYLITTEPNVDYATYKYQAPVATASTRQPPKTTNVSNAEKPVTKLKPCPGICVENVFVRYCGNTITEGWCEEGSTCCASNSDEQLPSTTISVPVRVPDKERETTTYQYIATDGTVTTLSTTTVSNGPPCPGSCVAPLFSLLCDAVDNSYYCANEGRCCVSRDPEPETTTVRILSRKPCTGACIPIFLRGMCNQPSQLISNTDCDVEFVCCYQPPVQDHLNPESAQIPLIRPHGPPMILSPIPVNTQMQSSHPLEKPMHSNHQPNRRPGISGPKPHPPNILQRPQMVNPNVGNRPGSGYIPPIPLVNQNIHQDNSAVKLTVPQNQNFYGVPQNQHSSNVTSSSHPVRLTVPSSSQSVSSQSDPKILSKNISSSISFASPSDKRPNYSQNVKYNSSNNVNVPSTTYDFQRLPGQNTNHKHSSSNANSGNTQADSDRLPTAGNNSVRLIPFQSKYPPIGNSPQVFSQPSTHQGPSTKSNSTKHFAHKPLSVAVGYEQQAEESVNNQASFIPLQTNPNYSGNHDRIKPPQPETTPNTKLSGGLLIQPEELKEHIQAGKPVCPGACIAPILRFTCFGSSTVYEEFSCDSAGDLCCSPIEDVRKFEEDRTGMVSGASSVSPTFDIPFSKSPNLSVCGIKGNKRKKTGRVVGGRTSSTGEWCWQIALINDKNQYLCGGALIGSRWVLTAAHCITALVRNGDAIYVRVGDFDLASQFGSPGAQTQKVSTSYIHHNHNGQTLDNDIALLRLENPVKLQNSVCLVCLPARGATNQPGKRCTVTGYGYQSESGPIALKVREAVIPIVEEGICSEQVNKVTEKRFILPAGSFCAGGESGNDACQGDGGGPMTCENDGYHELTGLVSWGFGCGKENVPGVYVKVSSYIGWINQIISVNN